MQIITMYHGLYMSGKIKDLRRFLREAGQIYTTVKELIESKLH
ncbi:hypothetical protein SAMN04488502_101176 [Dendrosporobacter quercicolus]|uniref:Uncharacterized protein n=1 Tax=Dendrosporobacter quercicolus TaxID=146817 RepID=A0A1G9KZM5_9FIRM|nr:hypothetical protein [Dendrosporobacter quercicolus]SDL55142.1 hypothetical protein SAMN04488502_101176 [Dendrosporobacter quercicolus]